MADLLEYFGDVPSERVRMVPTPGTATEHDLLETEARTGRICELIDGVLVEKPMGWYESVLAVALGRFLGNYLEQNPRGLLSGEAGFLRTVSGRTRAPDVAFVTWERIGSHSPRRQKILPVPPDLAIEIVSEGNTPAEMDRKLREYFAAGVRLVWYIDASTRTAMSYTGPDQGEPLHEDGLLTGGDVLPGFELSLRALFAAAEDVGAGPDPPAQS
ncbi:MAG: Uma2 family endonuclease [Pirellulales bacterium]|nr:Uma2 family endonuclease [Pirellulales bacterium]